jgi:site-specific recombinase XerD
VLRLDNLPLAVQKILKGGSRREQDRFIRREHVESFVADLLTRNKPATASNRYRALRVFFRWLAEEGEITESPMRNMSPPVIPETPVPVLSDDAIKRLLKACEGKDFADRRDMAIIRLFIDSGLRRAELAHLSVTDVDLDQNVVVVLGKGRRPRACPFGRKTAIALDRYVRVRAVHRAAHLDALWLGQRAPVTDSGVSQIVREARARRRHRRLAPAPTASHVRVRLAQRPIL